MLSFLMSKKLINKYYNSKEEGGFWPFSPGEKKDGGRTVKGVSLGEVVEGLVQSQKPKAENGALPKKLPRGSYLVDATGTVVEGAFKGYQFNLGPATRELISVYGGAIYLDVLSGSREIYRLIFGSIGDPFHNNVPFGNEQPWEKTDEQK